LRQAEAARHEPRALCGAIGAAIVVVWGLWLAKRQAARADAPAANEAPPPELLTAIKV
jgi:hypothetical protein